MKAIMMAGAALATAAAVTLAPSIKQDPDQQSAHRFAPAAQPATLGKLALNASEVLAEPACNATSFAQLPGDASLFIGRRLVTNEGKLAGISGPNDCSGGDPANEARGRPYNRWGLVLDRFDWKTRRFTGATVLLDTSPDPRNGQSRAIITGGPMRGLRIRSAYDPSVARLGDAIFVAFECTFENGDKYGVNQTSSCISVYDPTTRRLDMARTFVAVGGEDKDSVFQVAAVPRLLTFGGRLYLYWSALTIERGVINRATVRGAELVQQNGITQIKGSASVIRPFDPLSNEVWAVGEDKMSNRIVNLMGFWNDGDSFLAFAALGGEGCNDPLGQGRGCFRLAVKRSHTPLGQNGLGRGRMSICAYPVIHRNMPRLSLTPPGVTG
ncbi:hypothetical protein [Sphingobium sp. YG1]|uniref:hypothetical protein n=1 Tax=Sphingobium sp. YG1 TaxID=2082188 RepID=UPI0011AE76D1|nr:hypothetical protein [Sphingobium sp. YG1]